MGVPSRRRTGGSGLRTGPERLAEFGPGFAEEGAQVDEAGGQHETACFLDRNVGRQFRAIFAAAGAADEAGWRAVMALLAEAEMHRSGRDLHRCPH